MGLCFRDAVVEGKETARYQNIFFLDGIKGRTYFNLFPCGKPESNCNEKCYERY